LKLTVVGCSGSGPGPDSPASCYLVEADGFRIVLDLGQGAAGPLQGYTVPSTLGAILISHLHSDHCLDLTALAVILQYGPARPRAPIPVHAPTGAARRIALACGPETDEAQLAGFFDFKEPRDGQIGPFAVTFARMSHPVETYAVRLEHDGHTLVYTGDTGPTDALVELSRGADVLLAEAGWGGGSEAVPNLHLTGAAAGEHATRAGVRRLILTHVPAWGSVARARAEAQDTFSGRLDMARAGQVVDI
jgi:ribonuclease BN (tRNA processing enzyme)